jgi:hypothetical protein
MNIGARQRALSRKRLKAAGQSAKPGSPLRRDRECTSRRRRAAEWCDLSQRGETGSHSLFALAGFTARGDGAPFRAQLLPWPAPLFILDKSGRHGEVAEIPAEHSGKFSPKPLAFAPTGGPAEDLVKARTMTRVVDAEVRAPEAACQPRCLMQPDYVHRQHAGVKQHNRPQPEQGPVGDKTDIAGDSEHPQRHHALGAEGREH